MAGRNYFDDYGVQSGYNQTAPGRDVAPVRQQGQPGRPRTATPPAVANAIAPQMPAAQPPAAQPFAGAQQTMGANYAPHNGNTGISGGIGSDYASSVMHAGSQLAPGGLAKPMATPDQQATLAPGSGSPNAAPTPAAAPVFAPIDGFDFDKLSGKKAYDSKEKYSDAVRTFSQGLGSGVKVERNNLGGMVDYAHAHGFDHAQAVGDDKIDFGDGAGPIDIIRSNGKIWFQNGPDRFGGAAAPHPAVLQNAIAGGGQPNYLDPTVMQNAIAASGVPGGTDYTSRIMQQIQAALRGKL